MQKKVHGKLAPRFFFFAKPETQVINEITDKNCKTWLAVTKYG